MKKILSLFVTIALLMVSFTGCQNLMGTDTPSVETPKAPKVAHKITLEHNGRSLEGYAGETTYFPLPNVMGGTHIYDGFVLWADVTFKDAITNEILDIPVDIKDNRVYFTMPDKDIIFSAKSVVEHTVKFKSNANCMLSKYTTMPEKFKFGYFYGPYDVIPEEHKNLVKEAKASNGKDRWVYEITGWINPSDLKIDGSWYYFYVDDLVTYMDCGGVFTHLCILTQDENGNYNGSRLSV